ncbi:cation diffusion facilitator family transporter [Avibacterium paragallinarum]|uniref:cation diffusion facilitator family transporter n=1 Tax=Avibacterium paragallinarum TaxID=728 RepID=UPI000614FE92|nr:cation diffusion facilitator family transporter [Avibacterium paragallinarum]KAA6210063.1 cation diffusion facilitator family transporter [Avibacterium paragallinarum]KKB01949.1 ferrous iron transporter [Avibacterium paragallinarum]RZN73789.1 cation diffusion facilitator family transporter [Avibacterium paragallinarum]
MQEVYSKQVKSAANLAIATAFILILIKGFAWWKTDSVSMLASITDSTLDLLASFMNMLILRFALMPADHNHSFGHGKAESLASLIQSAFISGSAIFLLLQGIYRLTAPLPLTQTYLGVIVTLISIAATLLLVLYQSHIIKQTDSPAIKADRLHYQTDLRMNIAILCSLGLTLWGVLWADAIFAILIALYILFNAGQMFYDAIQLLLDQALPPEEIKQIEQVIQSQPNILGFHDLRTRRSGAIRFIQFHLELDDHLSFIEAHQITDHLEQRLRQCFPRVDIVIHHEPTSVVKNEEQDKVIMGDLSKNT